MVPPGGFGFPLLVWASPVGPVRCVVVSGLSRAFSWLVAPGWSVGPPPGLVLGSVFSRRGAFRFRFPPPPFPYSWAQDLHLWGQRGVQVDPTRSSSPLPPVHAAQRIHAICRVCPVLGGRTMLPLASLRVLASGAATHPHCVQKVRLDLSRFRLRDLGPLRDLLCVSCIRVDRPCDRGLDPAPDRWSD